MRCPLRAQYGRERVPAKPTIAVNSQSVRKGPAMMNRILVAYDDTETARRALDRAAELAKAFDSEVIVTSVAPLLVSSPRAMSPLDPTDSPALHAEELETARRMLSERGIEAELAPATGDPAGAIAMIG